MTNELVANPLEDLDQFAEEAAQVGACVAFFCLGSAYLTQIYREPGEPSIDAIDAQIGGPKDVPDPLTTAHRLAKFYVISAGDSLLASSRLIRGGNPLLVGSAALARATAEHASKAMFISEPQIGWKARVLRTHELFKSSLNEYQKDSPDGATQVIQNWNDWRARAGSQLGPVPKQPSAKNNRDLVERYSGKSLGYDELSRPTHGNAAWVSVTVIQEQKGTNFAVVSVLRNLMFAMNSCFAAANMLCELWDLDRNEVLRFVAEKNEVEAISWDQMVGLHQAVQEGVDLASANIVVDSTEDPQPAR